MKLYHVLLLFVSFHLNAQENIKIEKKSFKLIEAGFKVAWNNIKKGDKNYVKGKDFYNEALKFYLDAYKYNNKNAILNYKIGVCFFFTNNSSRAIQSFQKALYSDEKVAKDVLFLLARSFHLNHDFDTAIVFYNRFFNSLTPNKASEYKNIIPNYKRECENGKTLIKTNKRVFIDNLGTEINSIYPDYYPLISSDESSLIFTSRRNTSTGKRLNPIDNRYFEDIYISHFDSASNKWLQAEKLNGNINTPKNEAAVGYSNDGQTLYVYKGEANGGDIFRSKIKGDDWGGLKNMGSHFNSPDHESSISFSFDNNTAYFVSNRKDLSIGKRDIYIIEKNKKGKWGEARNIGSLINSTEDEEGVFIHPNNQSLYFSSKGHNTMGGFDIFKSEKDSSGAWGEPINLGYPINSAGDDLFFSMNANQKKAYFTSSRKESLGDKDIFMITFLGPEKPKLTSLEDNLIAIHESTKSDTIFASESSEIEIKTTMLCLVKGIVRDKQKLKMLEAVIEITDNHTGELITTVNSNSKSGRFLVPLPFGKNYGLTIQIKGYMFHSENFNIQDNNSKSFKEIKLDIEMQTIEKGTKIVLNNIFFDFGGTEPIADSYFELDRLLTLLNENKNVKLKILGHTDNIGTLKFNTDLSEARALAIVNYLIGKGLDKTRLSFEGAAYLKPIATNDTEIGRKINRRVEAEIVGN